MSDDSDNPAIIILFLLVCFFQWLFAGSPETTAPERVPPKKPEHEDSKPGVITHFVSPVPQQTLPTPPRPQPPALRPSPPPHPPRPPSQEQILFWATLFLTAAYKEILWRYPKRDGLHEEHDWVPLGAVLSRLKKHPRWSTAAFGLATQELIRRKFIEISASERVHVLWQRFPLAPISVLDPPYDDRLAREFIAKLQSQP